MEHRWGNRIAVDLPVWLNGSTISGPGVLRNLSASGAMVETALPLASLTLVRVQIPRNGAWPHTMAWGYVVRQDPLGIGIEWCDAAPLLAGAADQRSTSSRPVAP